MMPPYPNITNYEKNHNFEILVQTAFLKVRQSWNEFLKPKFPPKNKRRNSTLLLWNLRLTCFCSFYGGNWRQQNDFGMIIKDYSEKSEKHHFQLFLPLTGSWYMLTDKLYTNYFFIGIDWSTRKVSNFLSSKPFFYVKNQPNLSIFSH